MAEHKIMSSRKKKQKLLLLAIIAVLVFFLFIERMQEKTVSKDELSLIIGTEDITDSLKDDIIVQNGRSISKF